MDTRPSVGRIAHSFFAESTDREPKHAYLMERNPPKRHSFRRRLGRGNKRERRKTDLLERILRGLRHATPGRGLVRKTGQADFRDLRTDRPFWKGTLLVEHKSRGQDLDKAESQAFDYIHNLLREGCQDEVPRYVIVSDFARFALHDLEPEDDDRCR